MEAKDANPMVEQYRALGRPITLQRLNLTPAQKRDLRDFLRWNELEENRYYRYDYFLDNCSTRLRDALDRVLRRLAASGNGLDAHGAQLPPGKRASH